MVSFIWTQLGNLSNLCCSIAKWWGKLRSRCLLFTCDFWRWWAMEVLKEERERLDELCKKLHEKSFHIWHDWGTINYYLDTKQFIILIWWGCPSRMLWNYHWFALKWLDILSLIYDFTIWEFAITTLAVTRNHWGFFLIIIIL